MKKLIGLVTIAVLFTGISIGQAIDFGLATSFNFFSDSRLTGTGFAFTITSNIADDTKISYLAEQGNNTLTGQVAPAAPPANTK